MIVMVRRVNWKFEEIAHWQNGELTYNQDLIHTDPLYSFETSSQLCDSFDGPNLYAVPRSEWNVEKNRITSQRGRFDVPKSNRNGFHLDLTPADRKRNLTIHVQATKESIQTMKQSLHEYLHSSMSPEIEIPFTHVDSLKARLGLHLDGNEYTAMSAGTVGNPEQSDPESLVLHVTRDTALNIKTYCKSFTESVDPYRQQISTSAAVDFFNGVRLADAPPSEANHPSYRPSVSQDPMDAPVQTVITEISTKTTKQPRNEGSWVYYFTPSEGAGWQNMETGEVSHRKQRPGKPPKDDDGYGDWLAGWTAPPETLTKLWNGQILEVQVGNRTPELAVVVDTAGEHVSLRTEYSDDLFEDDVDLTILAVEDSTDSTLDDLPTWVKAYRDS